MSSTSTLKPARVLKTPAVTPGRSDAGERDQQRLRGVVVTVHVSTRLAPEGVRARGDQGASRGPVERQQRLPPPVRLARR